VVRLDLSFFFFSFFGIHRRKTRQSDAQQVSRIVSLNGEDNSTTADNETKAN